VDDNSGLWFYSKEVGDEIVVETNFLMGLFADEKNKNKSASCYFSQI
jgi:hypothetical protein